jgi:AcrR family transcriptional regulator
LTYSQAGVRRSWRPDIRLGSVLARSSAADRRERLLRATEELFAERPYDDVSIDDIAERAGVAHGLAFHYFGSKRGLYLAMLEWSGSRIVARFEQNTEADPAKWLRVELRILLEDASEAGQRFLSVVRNNSGAEVGELLARRRSEAATRLISKLAPTRDSPLLTLAAAAWVGYTNEFVAGWLDASDGSREQIIQILVDVLTAALTVVAGAEEPPGFDARAFAGY